MRAWSQIHVAEFGKTVEFQAAKWGECVDAEERCPAWAAAGECDKNSKCGSLPLLL